MENMLQSNLTPIFGNQQLFETYPLLIDSIFSLRFFVFLFMFIINLCVSIVMFRLFLIMDPKNGEISRPMRNRGVEICLLSPRIEELYDVTLLLQQRGLFGILFIYSILRQQTRDLT
jgi:hypothetical protein